MRISSVLSVLLLLLLATACSKNSDEAAEPEEPAVGASCEHLGATDGAYACDGNTVILCSVITDHKWEVAPDMFQCDEGETCSETGRAEDQIECS